MIYRRRLLSQHNAYKTTATSFVSIDVNKFYYANVVYFWKLHNV